jgi:hypothetical protein
VQLAVGDLLVLGLDAAGVKQLAGDLYIRIEGYKE